MRTIYQVSTAVVVTIVMVACGASGSTKKEGLEAKKAELKQLKEDQLKLGDKIAKLESDILKLDTTAAQEAKAKLVTLASLEPESFTHYIDLQGKIEAQNIAYVTPRNQGGQVKAIYVKQGDYVRKGQLLLKLDDNVIKEQIGQVQTQLELAKSIYDRRKNLWAQNIGTEVELLQAKTNMENLQKQIDILNAQLDMNNVYAEMSGVADEVTIKVGETFSAATATMSGIRIVNSDDLKVTANVPENYLDRVGVGSHLKVTMPEVGKTLDARVTVAGKLIDPNTRSFYIEARIPRDKDFRPNQIALVRIQDYTAKNVITVPVNTLQTDEQGKFVLVAGKEKNGQLVARKKRVTEGMMYNNELEIKSGLQPGDSLITDGFQGLYDGQLITTAVQ